MRSRHHRLRRSRRYGTLTALLLLGGSVGLSSAAADGVDAAPIAPHQAFFGQVNGATQGAAIKVGCFGPVTPNETGHPLAGQTVDVLPAIAVPVSADVGYTGESAARVIVQFGSTASVGSVVSISAYGVRVAVPTSLNLPCYGLGKVVFVPSPTSPTARNSTVPVTYVNVGVSPAP